MKIKYFTYPGGNLRLACLQAIDHFGFQITSDPSHHKHWQASKQIRTSIQGSIEEKITITVKQVPSGKHKVTVQSIAPVSCSSDLERAKHLERVVMDMILVFATSQILNSKKSATR